MSDEFKQKLSAISRQLSAKNYYKIETIIGR